MPCRKEETTEPVKNVRLEKTVTEAGGQTARHAGSEEGTSARSAAGTANPPLPRKREQLSRPAPKTGWQRLAAGTGAFAGRRRPDKDRHVTTRECDEPAERRLRAASSNQSTAERKADGAGPGG